MISRLRLLLAAAALAWGPVHTASADDLLIDAGRQIDGLWVFPSLSDPDRWKYVPAAARIVTDEDGRPQFSMTFYASDTAAEGTDPTDPSSIVQADGGALIHFLVEYTTDPELVESAEARLQRELDNEELEIAGPIVFDSGQFSLISSVLTDERVQSPTLLAQRPAPLLEGNRVAISAQMPSDLANILLGTLRTQTPDISVTFDMSFSGLSQAYDATMVIDWEKTKNSMAIGGGGTVYFVSADVEAAIERAVQNGAITLEVNGDDAAMDALIERVHSQALELMFAPVEVSDVPKDQQGGLMDSLMSLVGSEGMLSSGNTTGFGAYVNYRMKDIRSEGVTRLSFNKRQTISRRTALTVNAGGIVDEYGDEPGFIEYTSTVDLADQLRRIFITVDGELAGDIGNLVNSIQVAVRKSHPGGRETIAEMVVDADDLATDKAMGPLTYSNVEREAAEAWRQYDYQTSWSFQGGGEYVSPWTTSEAAMINLTAPYRRQEVNIEGEMAPLIESGVRAVIAEVQTDFFGDIKPDRRVVRPSEGEPVIVDPISMILPEGQYDYAYSLTWMMPGDVRLTKQGRDDLGFLFIDEIPEEAEAPEASETEDQE